MQHNTFSPSQKQPPQTANKEVQTRTIFLKSLKQQTQVPKASLSSNKTSKPNFQHPTPESTKTKTKMDPIPPTTHLFPCTKCAHKTKSAYTLKQHMLQKHTPGYNEQIIKYEYWTWQCSLCPWSTTDDNSIHQYHHTQGHRSNLMPCPYSNCITKDKTTFQTPEALSKHCADIHKDMYAMVKTSEAKPGKAWGLDGTRERFSKWKPPGVAAAAATPTDPGDVSHAGPSTGPSSAPGGFPPLPPFFPPS